MFTGRARRRTSRSLPLDAAALRVALLALLAGCAPSRVQSNRETSAVGLPKPSVVYVYDFAVDSSEVQLDPGGPLAAATGTRSRSRSAIRSPTSSQPASCSASRPWG